MTKTPARGFSISALNAAKASETPYEFELVIAGRPSGVFLKVEGAHSERVQNIINRAIDERNKADMAASSTLRPGEQMPPKTVAESESFNRKLCAARLVGWRGEGETDGLDAEQTKRFQPITDPFSEALALELVSTNPDAYAQVLTKSNDVGNFMKLSSGS